MARSLPTPFIIIEILSIKNNYRWSLFFYFLEVPPIVMAMLVNSLLVVPSLNHHWDFKIESNYLWGSVYSFGYPINHQHPIPLISSLAGMRNPNRQWWFLLDKKKEREKDARIFFYFLRINLQNTKWISRFSTERGLIMYYIFNPFSCTVVQMGILLKDRDPKY